MEIRGRAWVGEIDSHLCPRELVQERKEAISALIKRASSVRKGFGYRTAMGFSIFDRIGTIEEVNGFSANKANMPLCPACLFPVPSTATQSSLCSDKYLPIYS